MRSAVSMVAGPCPICGDTRTSFYRTCRDRRRGLPGEWTFWACARCGALFQHPLPTFEQLQSYYAAYSTGDDVKVTPSAGSRHERLRRWYHRVTGDVDPRDFVAAAAGARVLDYGCGAAPYLSYFRAHGVNIAGAEITPAIVTAYQAAGYEVALIDTMERIPFPNGEFDVVYMMQVIEHIARPHDLLKEVRRVLKPGGTLHLAMPNARSVWHRLFGANWVAGWFAPFHLFVYSSGSVRALAEAHQFQIVRQLSRTPEGWLRLNLKATLHPADDRLDSAGRAWLDRSPMREALSVALRVSEVVVRERDCLIVELRKC